MVDVVRDTLRGWIRVHVLHHAERGRIFGVEMIEELRRHGYAVSPGTLYPLLHDLEASGYLKSATEVVNGKVRRYYRCTARGRQALVRLRARVRELAEELLED